MKRRFFCLLIGWMLFCVNLFGCSMTGIESDMTGIESERVENMNIIERISESERVKFYGRTFFHDMFGANVIINSASGFEVKFSGTFLKMDILVKGVRNERFSVFVDGERDSEKNILSINRDVDGFKFKTVDIVKGLEEGEHTVKIIKRTMSSMSTCYVKNLETDGVFLELENKSNLKIEYFGDSVTCGEGVLREVRKENGQYIDSNNYNEDTETVTLSFAGIAANLLDAEYRVFGRGGSAMKYTTQQYSLLNNWKSVAFDLEIPYDYTTWTPDVVVIEMGINDYVQYLNNSNLKYTKFGMVSAILQFVEDCIGTNYGKDIPIILCSGILVPNSGLDEVMEEVKNRLIDDFPNIDIVNFEDCRLGHPIVSQSLEYGEILADRINELLNKGE